jgi:hypothetical protein
MTDPYAAGPTDYHSPFDSPPKQSSGRNPFALPAAAMLVFAMLLLAAMAFGFVGVSSEERLENIVGEDGMPQLAEAGVTARAAMNLVYGCGSLFGITAAFVLAFFVAKSQLWALVTSLVLVVLIGLYYVVGLLGLIAIASGIMEGDAPFQATGVDVAMQAVSVLGLLVSMVLLILAVWKRPDPAAAATAQQQQAWQAYYQQQQLSQQQPPQNPPAA